MLVLMITLHLGCCLDDCGRVGPEVGRYCCDADRPGMNSNLRIRPLDLLQRLLVSRFVSGRRTMLETNSPIGAGPLDPAGIDSSRRRKQVKAISFRSEAYAMPASDFVSHSARSVAGSATINPGSEAEQCHLSIWPLPLAKPFRYRCVPRAIQS